MRLTLIPQWGRPEAQISVAGDVLTVSGVESDLSDVAEGGEAYRWPEPGEEHLFIGPITRVDGVIHATIIAHVDDTATLDQPDAPWVVDATSGPVTIPALRIEAEGMP